MTKSNRYSASFLAFVAFGLIAPRAMAQASPDPLGGLNACRSITDTAARVTCYDKAVDALNSATQRKDIVIVDKAKVKETRKGLFGFNIGRLPIFGNGKDDSEEPEDKLLIAKVTSGKALADGRWRFMIEGGAMWETIEPLKSVREPKAGAEVQLEKAALGSYFLKIGSGRATRAKRVN